MAPVRESCGCEGTTKKIHILSSRAGEIFPREFRWMMVIIAMAVLPGFAQTRVMPLGDSITEGTGSSGGGFRGYRRPLWQALEDDYLVDFVGSLSDGDASFDRDHEGHAGWLASQVLSNVNTILQISDPEIVLLHIGTNDVSADRPVQDVIDDIDAILEASFDARSSNRVFLCAIVPRRDGKNPQTEALNNEIADLVEVRSANGDRVHLVDMYSEFVGVSNWQTALMANDLHPNDAGYAVMAEAFFDAITPYLNPAVPVELVSFEASLHGQGVMLQWSTASETNNFGFFVERKTGEQNFSALAFVPGHGTTTVPQAYQFLDAAPGPGENRYRLRQVDSNGAFEFSNVITVVNPLPQIFTLRQNYPNPFNEGTRISFGLPIASFVRLAIFDVNGREIVTLLEGEQKAGATEILWNGRDAGGRAMANGIYYFRMESGGQQDTKAMSLVR